MKVIRIHGGRIIDPANGIDQVTDLYLAAGRVAGLGERPEGFQDGLEIDARGKVVCPGLVDLGARLREPGQEHKGTIRSECRAAAAAGITTLLCPPDTDPVIDTPAVVELIRQRGEQAARARILTLGALTQDLDGENLSEMAALKRAGCVGISNAHRPLASTLVMLRALEYAATFDLKVYLHPQDPALSANGVVHEGAVSTRLGLPGIPEAAETVAVARDLALIERTGIAAHFCRLSSERSARMVARAQHDGLPVSADVAAHQLFLTEMDLLGFDSNCHLIPPLRTQRDRDGLRRALAEGSISAVCSDHQPHEPDAKLAPLGETEPGISALETLLPLVLRLVDEGVLDLPSAIARITSGPAAVIGVEAGTLTVGARADVCVFDPRAHWRLEPRELRSRGHNSPFRGWEFSGRVTHTVLGGRLVHGKEGEK